MSNLSLCAAGSHPHLGLLGQVITQMIFLAVHHLLYWSMYVARQIHLCLHLSMQEIAQAGTAGLASAAQDGQREQQRRREGV